MKAKVLTLIAFLIVIVGCNKDDNIQANINGEYVGIFERNENISNVELTFDNGTFKGQSEIDKFPAICRGTYVVSGNTITFTNDCPWTTNFDWSLILRDEWNFSLSNDVLIMTKPNGDKYTLTKQ